MMVSWPGTRSGLDLGLWVPCYAIGALFVGFACAYYGAKIPFGQVLTRWHFWTSVGGAVLFSIGYVLLTILGNHVVAAKAARQPPQWLLALSLLGLTLGPILFVSGQILFVIGLTKAIFRMVRHRNDDLTHRV